MIVVDSRLDMFHTIDETLIRINPIYEKYIEQLEDEVKSLRKLIAFIDILIPEGYKFKLDIKQELFSSIPQTPEWRG